MKKNNGKRRDLKALFDDNRFLKVVSVSIAIILWLGIASGDDKVSRYVENVPVDSSALSASIESIGMDIVKGGGQTVTVRVEGKREVVGNLKPNDIKVTPQIGESITDPGTYSLRLNAVKANSLDNYEIVSISPERVELSVDRVQSKKIKVEADIASLSIGEGYVLGAPTCSPAEISIKGAKSVVDSVVRAVAKVQSDTPLSQTTSFETKLMYFDEAGNQLNVAGSIEADADKVTVVVPVLKEATVPLRVGFTNVPNYLNTEFVRYTLSNSAIKVAGPIDVVDSILNITIGYLDLTKAKIGTALEFELELPTGFVNHDVFEKVTLTLDSAYYSTKAFNVSTFSVLGVPSTKKISVVTTSVDGVNMMGLKDDMSSLGADEISGEINVSGMDLKDGEMTVPVHMVVPSGKTVWATGTQTVTIKVENK